MTGSPHVILVDKQDREIGQQEKMAAHVDGALHRAFSVFVFRRRETLELLLQQRAHEKYHCGGLWTNTCCSHPMPGEETVAGGERRLFEELGLKLALKDVGEFHYTAHFDNGLIENEYDHVLVTTVEDCSVTENSDEVAEHRWISIENLQAELKAYPEKYTPWFNPALEIALKSIKFNP